MSLWTPLLGQNPLAFTTVYVAFVAAIETSTSPSAMFDSEAVAMPLCGPISISQPTNGKVIPPQPTGPTPIVAVPGSKVNSQLFILSGPPEPPALHEPVPSRPNPNVAEGPLISP